MSSHLALEIQEQVFRQRERVRSYHHHSSQTNHCSCSFQFMKSLKYYYQNKTQVKFNIKISIIHKLLITLIKKQILICIMIKQKLFLLFLLFFLSLNQQMTSLSGENLTLARNIINGAQAKYLPTTRYTKMAQFIANYFSQQFGNYWNFIIFPSTVTNAYSLPRTNYYAFVQKPESGLTYLGWKDVTCSQLDYEYWEVSNNTECLYGPGMTNSQILIIEQSIEQASVYKGNNIPDNSVYIAQKLSFGSWAVLIASPATNYGGFACNIKQFAKLGSYGIYKWTYLILRMS